MKKTIFLITGAVICLFAFNSCKDSKDSDTTLSFSTLTVEQQKQSIEDNGIKLADKMDDLQKTQAFEAVTQFIDRMNNNDSESGVPALAAPLRQLQSNLLNNDVNSLDKFNKQMRVACNEIDSLWGERSWNESTQEFDLTTKLDKKAIIHFPGDSLSTTNNATLTITYAESTVKAPDTDPVQYLPKSLSVNIIVGSKEVLKATFDGAYKTDATPTSLVQTLTIGDFNWNSTLTNTTKKASGSFTFKQKDETLLKYKVDAAGTLTADAMNDSTSNPEDVINSGHMFFQAMNIAIDGGIADVKGFAKEGNALKPDSIVHNYGEYSYTEYIYDSKSYCDKEVAIFNKYLKTYGYFVDKNQKFADVEFYAAESTETDYDNYNDNTGEYGTKKVYNSKPRLVLSDGSKVDMNNYKNQTGFEDLKNRLEDLKNKMESYK